MATPVWDDADYARAAMMLRTDFLAGRTVLFEFCPGDGNRHVILISPLAPVKRVGEVGLGLVDMDGGAVVTLVTVGTAYQVMLREGGYLSPGYVAEHWKLNHVDAEPIARLLTTIRGGKWYPG